MLWDGVNAFHRILRMVMDKEAQTNRNQYLAFKYIRTFLPVFPYCGDNEESQSMVVYISDCMCHRYIVYRNDLHQIR